jgi:serine/threonine protein kinase
VRTAQKLAQWLLHFHTVRWYHKGFRSSNVLFFTSSNLPDSGEIYITGFEHARTAGEGPTTIKPPTGVDKNDYYVHPDYLGGKRGDGYLQMYDVYSLGIVLVELAYWCPIYKIFEHIAATNGESPASNPDAVRAQVIKHTPKVLEDMRSRVGDHYMAAVVACLNGMEAWRSDDASHGSIGEANAALLYDFNDAVINTLQIIDM